MVTEPPRPKEHIEPPEELAEEVIDLLRGLKGRLHQLQFNDVGTDRAIDYIKGRVTDLGEAAEEGQNDRLRRAKGQVEWWQSAASSLYELLSDVERGVLTFPELRLQAKAIAETEFIE